MTIKKIKPYQILDSRGEPTLMVMMYSDTGNKAEFSVPSGASKGEYEAIEKRDGKGEYGGNGVTTCIDLINTSISPKFIGYPLDQLDDFDGLLIALDGSSNKQNLGANTLLALSGAYMKLSAIEKGQPLWQYIAEYNQSIPEFPRLFSNIIGGGKHAPGLDIQEYMIVPQSNKPSEAIPAIYDIYHTVRNIMQNLYGPSALLVGDEGGLAPIGTSTEVILETFSQLNSKMTMKFDIALDSAANSFYKNGLYNLESQSLHASDLFKLYEQWDSKFNIYAIEDPFAENDLEGTEILKGLRGKDKPFMVVGDDYTVTNKGKIEELQKDEIFDAIIIKPNQVGTFSETFQAIQAAKLSKSKVIISHRSGETEDTSIVDLAYGVGAMGLKLGAPVRGERVSKFNRLLEIEADLSEGQTNSASKVPTQVNPMPVEKDSNSYQTIPAPQQTTQVPYTGSNTVPPSTGPEFTAPDSALNNLTATTQSNTTPETNSSPTSTDLPSPKLST